MPNDTNVPAPPVLDVVKKIEDYFLPSFPQLSDSELQLHKQLGQSPSDVRDATGWRVISRLITFRYIPKEGQKVQFSLEASGGEQPAGNSVGITMDVMESGMVDPDQRRRFDGKANGAIELTAGPASAEPLGKVATIADALIKSVVASSMVIHP